MNIQEKLNFLSKEGNWNEMYLFIWRQGLFVGFILGAIFGAFGAVALYAYLGYIK